MPKSIFVAATGFGAGKTEGALALAAAFSKAGHRVGYFKPVVSQAAEATAQAAKQCGASLSDSWWALNCETAADLLNKGQESGLLEEVLPKYFQAAAACDILVVEGADLGGPASAVMFNLNGALAAGLGSPVLLLAEGGCPEAALAASLSLEALKGRQAEILGCVLVGGTEADAEKLKKISSVENLAACAVKDAATLVGPGAALAEAALKFEPRNMSPKRFEYSLIERAKKHKQHIVLPEGQDDRILLAADNILRRDFCDLTVLGDPGAIKARCAELKLDLGRAQIINPQESPWFEEFAATYAELRKHKGITLEKARERLSDINYFGTMMIYAKKADGMVSGACNTTAATVRPALEFIKTKPGCSTASSVFLMCLADRVNVYGDCAISIKPTPSQLAEIALSSAQTAAAFGIEPRVAMLSYSTGSSGSGPDVDAVKEATKIALESAEKIFPGLKLDGPLQFDAAVDPATAKAKMPNSEVAGQATVMIFPDLNAGNNCYKAVQRMAGAVAIGPVIQGLNAPVNDLSRGALVADIINTVAITAIQAQFDKGLK